MAQAARRRKKDIPAPILAMALLWGLGLSGCSDGGQGGDSALTRLATVPLGAEVTGLFLTRSGTLFFNAQHPADTNEAPYNRATIGVVEGYSFHQLPETFTSLTVPASRMEKQRVRVAVGSYRILGREDATPEGSVPNGLGGITDDGATGDTEIRQSNDPDFNGYVPTASDGSEGYLYTNWEDRPGGMSRLHIRRDEDGAWGLVGGRGEMLDFSSVDGTWVNCFGTVSPWGTPLSSEELYFDETDGWNDLGHAGIGGVQDLAEYLGYPRDGSGPWPNPYDYGYIVEIKNADKESPVIEKRYAMGRFSHENAVVMPDRKTAYLSDDGTGTVLFKFVADAAGDLSRGTLFAARMTQDQAIRDPAEAGFAIQWIELGRGSQSEIATWIAEYDSVTVDSDSRPDYLTDQQINDWAEAKRDTDLDGDGEIAASPFPDDRIAFLESRKAAERLGATAELRKMEGVNINYAGAESGSAPYMYMAVSKVDRTMSDERGDIRLAPNACGVVYRLRLESGYNVSRMEPVLAGEPHAPGATGGSCAEDSVSQPDNLVVMRDGRVIIGEDGGGHENNMVWVFSPAAE